ncbi:hypothetical protein C8J57DRAFT_1540018 [Mycena rebaudengoi]|nr:hypothetical protein C8J57DRAFT_1540018 [Mycena rebaudengoi]
MRATSTYFTILMAVAQVSFANWAPEKGAQVNFYTDSGCGQYAGEVAVWWNKSPAVGVAGRDADCITLNMPSNSKSIKTVGLWPASTVQPRTVSGHCSFWDGFRDMPASKEHRWVPVEERSVLVDTPVRFFFFLAQFIRLISGLEIQELPQPTHQ